jgi:hypothetical protein
VGNNGSTPGTARANGAELKGKGAADDLEGVKPYFEPDRDGKEGQKQTEELKR